MCGNVAIVADLGGTKIKIGLMREDRLIANASIPSHSEKGLKTRLPVIASEINALIKEAQCIADIKGMGIAIPGIVDSVEKKILSIDKKFEDAPDLDLEHWVKDNWNAQLEIENDARAALLGEAAYGNAKGNNNAVMMTIGTGIGSAAIMEGKLLKGKHFLAGILGGHLTVNYLGEKCNCGNTGCAEAEVATWNLERLAKSSPLFDNSKLKGENKIDYESIFRLSKAADELAQKLQTRSLKVWSAAAINLIHAYDPEILVIGGGVIASKDDIIPAIQEQIIKHAWTPWGTVKVSPAKFINESALLGIGSIILNHTN